MECSNCYEVYDDKERIPRNLPCGHTYCEFCLTKIYQTKNKLECPVCRIEVDPSIKANHLSKNYVAMEVSSKHREIQKKLFFCSSHSEPLRFFCDTCQVNICPSCIIDHNGHKFIKQDHSVPALKQRSTELKGRIVKKLDEMKSYKTSNEESKNNILQTQAQHFKYIDEEFDTIIARIISKREALKLNYQDKCQEEMELLEKEISKLDSSLKDLTTIMEEVDGYIEKVEKVKIIQGEEFHRELNELEDKINKESNYSKNVISTPIILPKIIIDPLLYREIEHIGITVKALKNLRICFFGEKNKILIYHIERDTWTLTHLPIGEVYEFNYYSSAVTLPNGHILITGGGISNSVYQISLEASQSSSFNQQVKIMPKASMHQSRKEHASVFLKGAVYVLGGYNGMMNKFLNSCERFDLESNEWTPISKMLIPKCAFGATTLANRYIFTLGGYDGKDRLNTIEKYDIQTDKWSLLEVKLKQSLSNSACFSHSDNSIVILGGGYNSGFCLETSQLNITDYTWKQLPPMNDGKDLRNKIVSINGNVYAIGGNNCMTERFCIKKGTWQLLSSYKEFLDDNLDSWSCALYYDTPKRHEEIKSQNNQNYGMRLQHQNYHQPYEHENDYDNLYGADDILSDEESGLEEWM